MSRDFGTVLRDIRLAKGMSQEEFASLLGTTKQVISRYENGQRTPKITVAKEYADLLGIPLTILLGEEGATEQSVRPSKRGVKIPVLGRSDSQALDIKNGTDKRLESIIKSYQELNDAGKDDLLKYAEHLIYIPEYKKGDTSTSEKSKIG